MYSYEKGDLNLRKYLRKRLGWCPFVVHSKLQYIQLSNYNSNGNEIYPSNPSPLQGLGLEGDFFALKKSSYFL